MDRGGDDQGKAVSKNDYSSSSSKKRQRVHTNSKAVETTAGKAVATVATKRPRRLQSGLLYDDDDGDHDLYNDDETSAAWITVGNPSYARTYIDGIQRRGDNETNHGLSSSRISLFHDPDFVAGPDSIEGTITTASRKAVKCWCSPPQPAVLSYSKGTGAVGKLNQPFYCCGNNGNRKCKFFKWAYQPQLTHWYRFGKHNHHTLVLNDTIDYNLCVGLNGGFSAKDLVQGKVGDCWFLSALAVIAERPDLIQRLFPNHHDSVLSDEHDKYGIIQVKLFMDGYWKTITMDTFLPCLLEFQSNDVEAGLKMHQDQEMDRKMLTPLSSCTDVHALSNTSRDIIKETKQFLYHDRQKKGIFSSLSSHSNDSSGIDPIHLNRPVNSNDLAYSKAQNQQLWVQFLEKAYAKIHGSYQSISGGHIAEAFLDLTGSPTLTQRFDDPNFITMVSFAEFHSNQRKQRAWNHTEQTDIKKENSSNEGSIYIKQEDAASSSAFQQSRQKVGQVLETFEVQLAVVLLIYFDLIITTITHVYTANIFKMLARGNPNNMDIHQDGIEHHIPRVLPSIDSFTAVCFFLEIGALLYAFQLQFFTHAGYIIDLLVICSIFYAEHYEMDLFPMRFLGFLRVWRVGCLLSTAMNKLNHDHDETKKKLKDVENETEKLQRDLKYNDEIHEKEKETRRQIEIMLQSYKDEVDTLKEALTIAAIDVATVKPTE